MPQFCRILIKKSPVAINCRRIQAATIISLEAETAISERAGFSKKHQRISFQSHFHTYCLFQKTSDFRALRRSRIFSPGFPASITIWIIIWHTRTGRFCARGCFFNSLEIQEKAHPANPPDFKFSGTYISVKKGIFAVFPKLCKLPLNTVQFLRIFKS